MLALLARVQKLQPALGRRPEYPANCTPLPRGKRTSPHDLQNPCRTRRSARTISYGDPIDGPVVTRVRDFKAGFVESLHVALAEVLGCRVGSARVDTSLGAVRHGRNRSPRRRIPWAEGHRQGKSEDPGCRRKRCVSHGPRIAPPAPADEGDRERGCERSRGHARIVDSEPVSELASCRTAAARKAEPYNSLLTAASRLMKTSQLTVLSDLKSAATWGDPRSDGFALDLVAERVVCGLNINPGFWTRPPR